MNSHQDTHLSSANYIPIINTNDPTANLSENSIILSPKMKSLNDIPVYSLGAHHIQLQLIEMGFDIQLVNNVLQYFEINSMEKAIDYVTKVDQKWNHPFVKVEDSSQNRCLVCQESSDTHVINYFSSTSTVQQGNRGEHDRSLSRKSLIAKKKRDINVENRNMILKRNNPPGVPCNICLSEISHEFTLSCKHKYCIDCIAEYIRNKIYASEVECISCPEGKEKCSYIISEDEIKGLLSSKDVENYHKFLNRAKISKIPNAVFCPISDCNSYAIPLPSFNKQTRIIPEILTCIANNHSFCNICKQLAHPGLRCEKKYEKDFKVWTNRKDVKKCPKCSFFIQKNEGCNHMTCANSACRYQFCWICMGEYGPNHFGNPFLPCWGMQNINQRNILIKYQWLRFFKFFFTFLLMITLAILAIAFAGCIMSFYILKKRLKRRALKFRISRGLKYIIVLALAFHLGIGLAPVGYLLVAVLIVLSPLIGIVYLWRKRIGMY